MLKHKTILACAGGSLCLAVVASGGDPGMQHGDSPRSGRHHLVHLGAQETPVLAYEHQGRLKRLYGRPFSIGVTPEDSARRFIEANGPLLKVDPADLRAEADHLAAGHMVPVMYDRDTGQYKFTAVYYQQYHGDLPVYGARLTTLVRNREGYPLVLANPDLRDLTGFAVPAAMAAPGAAMDRGVRQSILDHARAISTMPGQPVIRTSRRVIWAGMDQPGVQPRVAEEAVVAIGVDRWRILADADTGAVLHEEHLIHHADIEGTVEGRVTDGVGAEQCEEEVAKPLPYVKVTAGTATTFTDEAGHYEFEDVPAVPTTVTSTLNGLWFDVLNVAGSETSEAEVGTPPAVVDLLFNEANLDPQIRAQVNGYRDSNIVRDYALLYNPLYPTLDEGGFPVNVNRTDGFCPGNAWYDPTDVTINFCLAGSGFPNTAWTSVIYHEYGHHLVNAGGSGQGEYGEGMSDTISVLILDDPRLGFGFFGDCSSSLRTADNTCQYLASGCSTCGSAIHTCGQLISGCVWDTREELELTKPGMALDIISNLTINSILLHSGSSIDPGITIDYLTLDDDNETIFDGTPHYQEINAGFGAHGMPGPELALIAFSFPDGIPDLISPSGATTVRVDVEPLLETPQPGTGSMVFDDGTGAVTIPMTQLAPNEYEVAFPASACTTQVSFYFKAQTKGGEEQTWPVSAPDDPFLAVAATDSTVVFIDDFEGETGWTTSGSAIDGQWERDVPITTCSRGNPHEDADGSGSCYLTDNSAASFCNSDVDDGATILTSADLDASDEGAFISYWRWYSNTEGAAPESDIFEVEVSDNGGSTWVELETVGPSGPEVDGGWFFREFRVADYVDPSSQFRVRFTASDLGSGSVVEAAVDGVMLRRFLCDAAACPEDLDGSDDVGFSDLLMILSQWGPCGGCPEDLDASGDVGFSDLLMVLSAWGPCPSP